jgi:predicted exporter
VKLAEQNSAGEHLEVSTPVGAFRFEGKQLFPVLLTCLFALFIGYILWVHDTRADTREQAAVSSLSHVQAAIDRQEKAIREKIEKEQSNQRVLVYVLSLTQDERTKLNLTKPPELREMQR